MLSYLKSFFVKKQDYTPTQPREPNVINALNVMRSCQDPETRPLSGTPREVVRDIHILHTALITLQTFHPMSTDEIDIIRHGCFYICDVRNASALEWLILREGDIQTIIETTERILRSTVLYGF